jgi:hypothetical protein
MLGGATVEEYLTEEEFIHNIIKKGIADEILNKNDYLEYLYEGNNSRTETQRIRRTESIGKKIISRQIDGVDASSIRRCINCTV